MGLGPSNVAPSVLKAISDPVLGHLNPVFVQMMEEIKAMLRAVFQTKSEMAGTKGTGFAPAHSAVSTLPDPNGHQLSGIDTPTCHPRWKKIGPFEGLWGQVSKHMKYAHRSVSP